jgi:hypothetical protein
MNKLSLDNQMITDVTLSQELFSKTLLIDLSTADTKNRYVSFWEHEVDKARRIDWYATPMIVTYVADKSPDASRVNVELCVDERLR